MSPTPSLDGEIIGTYRPPKTYYQPPKTTYKPPANYREEPYQNTRGGVSDAERQRAIAEAQARERARLIAEAQARARAEAQARARAAAEAQRKLEARNWYIADRANWKEEQKKSKITNLQTFWDANPITMGINQLPPIQRDPNARPITMGIYPLPGNDEQISGLRNDPSKGFGTVQNFADYREGWGGLKPGASSYDSSLKLSKEEGIAHNALVEERWNMYKETYGDIKNAKDYMKYVYDTDMPGSRLTRLTRYIDGIPIEFYTWRGMDGNLQNIAAPLGYNTPNQRNFVDAWSDARLPIPTDAVIPTDTLSSSGIGGGEEYYEYPDYGYGGGGGFSFGGGGGGGGYYGNAYNEALKHFSTLVKWVI